MGPEGDRPGRPTQTLRHTCSEKLEIFKILCYIVKICFWQEDAPPWPMGSCAYAHLSTMVITALGTAMSASYGELLLKLDREGRLRT